MNTNIQEFFVTSTLNPTELLFSGLGETTIKNCKIIDSRTLTIGACRSLHSKSRFKKLPPSQNCTLVTSHFDVITNPIDTNFDLLNTSSKNPLNRTKQGCGYSYNTKHCGNMYLRKQMDTTLNATTKQSNQHVKFKS